MNKLIIFDEISSCAQKKIVGYDSWRFWPSMFFYFSKKSCHRAIEDRSNRSYYINIYYYYTLLTSKTIYLLLSRAKRLSVDSWTFLAFPVRICIFTQNVYYTSRIVDRGRSVILKLILCFIITLLLAATASATAVALWRSAAQFRRRATNSSVWKKKPITMIILCIKYETDIFVILMPGGII